MAACDVFRYLTLGAEGYHDNCSDNLRMAMMAIGQPVTHVPQPFNVWMNIPVHPDWNVVWKAPVSRPGDHVVLRAEMDCIVAMSACPQDMIPINGEHCPRGLVCLGCVHAQPKKSAMPVFERMRASHTRQLERAEQRREPLGQLAARRLELSRIEQALRRTHELATDVATAMEEALER